MPDPTIRPKPFNKVGAQLPPEREVDCLCDPQLNRSIYRDHTGINERVSACMRCGAVSYVECNVIEPRPHDVQCVGNTILQIDTAALDWLARWPRLAWGVWQQDRSIYLPADTRVETVEELKKLEEAALAEQKELSIVDRLRLVDTPSDASPAELPKPLAAFEQVQQGLALTPDMDFDMLIEMSDMMRWSSSFAIDLLADKPELNPRLLTMLQSSSNDSVKKALWIVRQLRLHDGPFLAAVSELLEKAGRDETALHPILDSLVYFGTDAITLGPQLKEVMRKVKSNYYLHKRVEQVLDIISTYPPS